MSSNILLLCSIVCLGSAWSQQETNSGSCYAQQIPSSNIAERLNAIKATLETIAEKVLGK